MKMTELLEFVKNYKACNEEEEEERESFLQFLRAFEDRAYLRENLVGHLSSSVFVLNKERTKVLLIYHNMFKTWTWVGGHADGDKNLLRVALKETREETGLKNIRVIGEKPIDLNVMVVHNHYKRGKFVPRHLHYNVVYIFEADENEETHIKPDENSGVKWVDIDELCNYCTNEFHKAYYERIMKKIREGRFQ